MVGKISAIKKAYSLHSHSYNRNKVILHYFGEVERYKCNKEFSRLKDKRVYPNTPSFKANCSLQIADTILDSQLNVLAKV